MSPPPTVLDRRRCERELLVLLPWLRRRALAMARDAQEVDDLVQATAERALRFWQQFRAETNYQGWLHRILINLFIEGQRRRRELPVPPLDLAHLPAPEVDPPARWSSFSLDEVRAALPRIEQPLRALMDARLAGDTTYRSLARQFGILPATVATRLFRGREKLRDVLMGADT